MIHYLSIIGNFILKNIPISVLILNILLSIMIVFREKKPSASTWAWILVLSFIPIVGFFLYLLLGRGLSRIRLFDLQIQKKIGMMEELAKQQESMRSGEYPNPAIGDIDARGLIHMVTVFENNYYASHSKVKLFTDGRKKFDALIKDIKNAKHHIHFQYYIFRMDNLGKEIYTELLAAQKRGVKVRILLDAWGSHGVKKKTFCELIHAGGDVVFFFPIKLISSFRVNYRNHRKIVVIDGKVAYTGGFNVGDEYLGLSKKFGYWRDNHLRLTGEGVYSLQNRFIMDWNSQHSNEIKKPEKYFPQEMDWGDLHLQIVTSGPNSHDEEVKNVYLKMINMAQKEILIQTPYYIPDESIHEALKTALMSGISVHLQIPNKPDHPFVYWATYSFAAELLDYGAVVETYEKGFVHAKTIIIDLGIVSIGSANIDVRSFNLDFEVNALIYNKDFAEKARQAFYADETDYHVVTKEEYESRSLIIRFKESLARLISPLL
ncbi:MAG: cardiolipin synthase [Streptococcaceae bacterium]|jgi:cardiolipin synthase|nr:cardiolipin synthase [Streptococcaceae bacterium]